MHCLYQVITRIFPVMFVLFIISCADNNEISSNNILSSSKNKTNLSVNKGISNSGDAEGERIKWLIDAKDNMAILSIEDGFGDSEFFVFDAGVLNRVTSSVNGNVAYTHNNGRDAVIVFENSTTNMTEVYLYRSSSRNVTKIYESINAIDALSMNETSAVWFEQNAGDEQVRIYDLNSGNINTFANDSVVDDLCVIRDEVFFLNKDMEVGLKYLAKLDLISDSFTRIRTELADNSTGVSIACGGNRVSVVGNSSGADYLSLYSNSNTNDYFYYDVISEEITNLDVSPLNYRLSLNNDGSFYFYSRKATLNSKYQSLDGVRTVIGKKDWPGLVYDTVAYNGYLMISGVNFKNEYGLYLHNSSTNETELVYTLDTSTGATSIDNIALTDNMLVIGDDLGNLIYTTGHGLF